MKISFENEVGGKQPDLNEELRWERISNGKMYSVHTLYRTPARQFSTGLYFCFGWGRRVLFHPWSKGEYRNMVCVLQF